MSLYLFVYSAYRGLLLCYLLSVLVLVFLELVLFIQQFLDLPL